MSTATGLPERFLDQANVPRNTEHNGKTRMLTLSERVSWLIRDRDEARKLAADAQGALESARLQLDCCSAGCGTDEQYACRRCCRIMLANYAANHGTRCDAEQERLLRVGSEAHDKLAKYERVIEAAKLVRYAPTFQRRRYAIANMETAIDALDAEDGQ